MKIAKTVSIFFLLIISFFGIAHAETSACPNETEGGVCITCSGAACMNSWNEDICAGTFYSESFGNVMWVGGSDPCVCYCPFSLYMDYYNSKCDVCPSTKCDSRYYQTGGHCDWTTQGTCTYDSSIVCENGCNPVTNECNGTPDLCDEVTCSATRCNGNSLETGSQGCDPATGDCTYSSSAPCPNGCDYSKSECLPDASSEQDPCVGVTCDNICTPGLSAYDATGANTEAMNGILKYDGECDSTASITGNDLCYYSEKTCFECSANKKDCIEICDNGVNDNLDARVDCDEPSCATSPACSCMTSSGGSGWTALAKDSKPSGSINVIIVGDEFQSIKQLERDAKFLGQASLIASAFGGVEPFKSNISRFKFYSTRVNAGKSEGADPVAYAMQKCNSSDKDYYISLHGKSTEEGGKADICGNKLQIFKTLGLTNMELQLYALHEFGHAFGCLWDEYDTHYDNLDDSLYSDIDQQKYDQIYLKQFKKAKAEGDTVKMKDIEKQISVPSAAGTYRKSWQWMIHGMYYDTTNCSVQVDVTGADCVQDFSSILSGRNWFTKTPECFAGCTAPFWFKSTKDDTIMRDVQDGGWKSFLNGAAPTYSPTARAYLESKILNTPIVRWVNPKSIPSITENPGAGGSLPSEWEK